MSNAQARFLGSAIAILAGGVTASAPGLDENVGLAIVLIASAIFLVEYVRLRSG